MLVARPQKRHRSNDMDAAANSPRHIALIGMMGCGKSTVGRELASLSERNFIDLDLKIEARQHRTISQIFSEVGESAFRGMEFDALLHALAEPPAIISTGGGAVQAAVNREVLWAGSFVVYLKASSDCLWERVRRSRNRPLLQQDNPKKVLEDLLAAREPRYLEAHYVAEVEHSAIDDIAHHIWEAYRQHHPN